MRDWMTPGDIITDGDRRDGRDIRSPNAELITSSVPVVGRRGSRLSTIERDGSTWPYTIPLRRDELSIVAEVEP